MAGTPRERCQERVWRRSGRFGSWERCQRDAKVYRSGGHYCAQHDPAVVKEKEAAKEAERQRRNAAADLAFNRKRDLAAKRDAVIEAARLFCSLPDVTDAQAERSNDAMRALHAAVGDLEEAERAT